MDGIRVKLESIIDEYGLTFHPDDPVEDEDVNAFIDYAFSVLGDGVYDLCIEIIKEKGLWESI